MLRRIWITLLIAVLMPLVVAPGHDTAEASKNERCSQIGELAICELYEDPTRPPPVDDLAAPVVPYWVWYQLTCLSWDDGPACNKGGYQPCETIGQEGRVYVLMRQDFIPPSAPYRYGDPVCVLSTKDLETPDRPDPIPGQRELDQFQYAKPKINVEPGSNTLIRFNNNIYTKKFEQSWKTELLGKEVLLRAYPVEFRWDYGDGTTFVTDKPGWPKRLDEGDVVTDTSHAYSNTGTYTVTLTTIYKAMYSVEGKPELPVDGQAEVVSEPVTIDVWRTDIRNVDEACAENPESWGCPGTTP